MSGATRQAAWRQRQKAAGVSGRAHGIKGLTLPELNHLRECLATYRRVTPVTPERNSRAPSDEPKAAPDPVTPVTPVHPNYSWVQKIQAEIAERERKEQEAWEALSPDEQAQVLRVKAQRDARHKARAQKAAETRLKNQPYATSTFKRYSLDQLRVIRGDNHPDRNADGDSRLYQLAVEEIDRRRAKGVTP
jgi:hypothetical protein